MVPSLSDIALIFAISSKDNGRVATNLFVLHGISITTMATLVWSVVYSRDKQTNNVDRHYIHKVYCFIFALHRVNRVLVVKQMNTFVVFSTPDNIHIQKNSSRIPSEIELLHE